MAYTEIKLAGQKASAARNHARNTNSALAEMVCEVGFPFTVFSYVWRTLSLHPGGRFRCCPGGRQLFVNSSC